MNRMRRLHLRPTLMAGLLAVAVGLSACAAPGSQSAAAEPMACQRAALVNPMLAHGLGGTGAPASPVGLGGTGQVASTQGVGGTGAPASPVGLGGTGQVASTQGVGGTGAPAAPVGLGGTGQVAMPGGVGGTGIPAATDGVGGTGVVGIVTGFASICVNGLEVEYSTKTPVSRDGKQVGLAELAVGQVVVLKAVQGADGQLHAAHIEVQDALVGPITSVHAEQKTLGVMGETVRVSHAAWRDDVAVGQWVSVSGHRLPDATVRATHIQPVAAGSAQVQGIALKDQIGDAVVGGTQIELSANDKAQWPTVPTEVRVVGRWVAGRLVADQLLLQPTLTAVGDADEVVLEGYVHGLSKGQMALGYASMNADVAKLSKSGITEGERVVVRAKLDAEKNWRAESVSPRAERRAGEADTSAAKASVSAAASTDASSDQNSGVSKSTSGGSSSSGNSNAGGNSGNSNAGGNSGNSNAGGNSGNSNAGGNSGNSNAGGNGKGRGKGKSS